MNDRETGAICPRQSCRACQRCVFGNRPKTMNERAMELLPLELEHDTKAGLAERIRLDVAIEASALAG
jgi:hypothetical protein